MHHLGALLKDLPNQSLHFTKTHGWPISTFNFEKCWSKHVQTPILKTASQSETCVEVCHLCGSVLQWKIKPWRVHNVISSWNDNSQATVVMMTWIWKGLLRYGYDQPRKKGWCVSGQINPVRARRDHLCWNSVLSSQQAAPRYQESTCLSRPGSLRAK